MVVALGSAHDQFLPLLAAGGLRLRAGAQDKSPILQRGTLDIGKFIHPERDLQSAKCPTFPSQKT